MMIFQKLSGPGSDKNIDALSKIPKVQFKISNNDLVMRLDDREDVNVSVDQAR